MSEETVIMDGSNPQQENAKRAKVVNNIHFQNNLVDKQQQQAKKMSVLKGLAYVAGGAGIGILSMGFMPSTSDIHREDPEAPILVPDEPQQAVSVNDNMSYDQAWEAARAEVGPGGFFVWRGQEFSTYSQEEWQNLDAEDQKEFTQNMHNEHMENEKLHQEEPPAVVVHDTAPEAHGVSDDMSFQDAFAVARQEVGPGGVFEWHGKQYNTYYKEEWDHMTEEDRHEFVASYQHESPHETIQQASVEQVPEAEIVYNQADTLIKEEQMTLDNGEQVRVGYFQQEDKVVIKVDIDNNNQYDYIVDTDTHQLIGLNGNQDVDLNQLTHANTDAQPIMSETMQIEGYDALVTAYSDGHQEAQVDIDGDGTYDTKLSIDTQGHVEMYDNNGLLIAEQDININDPIYPDPEPIIYNDIDQDLINDQLVQNEFGDDFNNDANVSGWMHDDIG